MYPDSQEHEWDTPPNGDFVRYLERLAASASAVSPVLAPTSSTPQAGAAKPVPTTAPPASPLGSQPAAVLSVLHKGRIILLWLTLAHLAAWLLFDRGSVPLLILMASAWVAWGRALVALSGANTANAARSGLEKLQQKLRSLAQQRQHEKSKK